MSAATIHCPVRRAFALRYARPAGLPAPCSPRAATKSATLHRWIRAGLLCLLVHAAACTADATSPPGGLPQDLPPGIYRVISLSAGGSGGERVDLYLEHVRVPAAVAAYQGEIAWDASRRTLAAVQLPPGMVGATHQGAPGRVRSSGSAALGLGDSPVLTLVFDRQGAAHDAITVTFEEVTSDDFTDVTSLAVSGKPFVVRR